MKDIFNSRQRFSIRKFSFGAASVLLGTVLFAQAPVAHASETETTTVEQAENTEKASASTEEAPQPATETPVVATTVEPTTEKTETSKEPVVEVAEAPLAANKSTLSAKIAEVEALLARAHKATDKSARDTAASALAQAKTVLAQTDASQTEVDAETAKLDLFVTVLAEASQQAQASEKAETAKVAAQNAPAEKTALEQTKSEAEVTNRLANQFVEKEAPQKNVSADLTNAIKAAVAQNEANIEQAATVLADKNATSQNYKQSMAQLQASIDAVYVSLRKSGKEEFEVALAAEGVDTTSLQSTVETLEKLLNSGNLEAVDANLKTESQTELAKGKAMLTDTTSTAEEVAAMVKKLKDLGRKMTLQIPLTVGSTQAINNAEIGKGVGVLVDETSKVTPDMTDPNGASLKDQDIPKYENVQLQPTSAANRSTFAYGGLYYLKFANIDVTNPQLAPTYYVRGSRSTNTTDDSILVEVVKIQDNSVVETHTLQPGGEAESAILTIDDRIPPFYGFRNNHIHFKYDDTTKSETSLGKLGYYLSHPGSAWAMGTYEIPAEAKYITKYMTTDGKELATYTMKGWSNQLSTPSEKREFDEYTYIETLVKGTPEFNIDEIDSVERLAQQYNAKLLKRVVKEDGTVIKTLYIKDPTITNAQAAPAEGGDTTGYIKVFETSEIAPGQTNTKLKFFFGNDTLMSNGQPLVTEETAKEIEEKAALNTGNSTDNTVRIYTHPDDIGKPEGPTIRSIDIGFVGNNAAARPYGIVEPGKSLYIRNRTVTFLNAQGQNAAPNNFQLVPLYNELIYVPEVVHLYEPAVSVKVKYVDEDGNEITGTGKDFPSGGDKAIPTGGVTIIDKAALVEVDKQTPRYDATPERPGRIVAADGTVYVFEKVTDDSAPESDNLKKGNHVVKYRFKKATGNVVIKYENVQGEQIAADQKDVDNQVITDPAKTYDATENDNTKQERPEKITTLDGTVYYYEGTSANINKSFYDNNTPNDKTDDTVAAANGDVKIGTTTITHVYDKAGSVVINYINTDGTVIKTEVADQAADGSAVTNVKKGTAYNATDKDQKPTEIKVGDKVYKLVTQAGTTRGTTALNYDKDGVVTATSTNSTDLGDNRVIAGAEGEVEAGKTKVVTYVYEEVLGKVAVKYIATDGTVLDGDVTLNDETTTTNVPTDGVEVTFGVGALTQNATSGGEAYDTADKRPNKITKDGKVYYKVATTGTTTSGVNYVDGVATGDKNAPASGKVVAGETQTVTYVYAPAGNVAVKYITTDGTQLTGDLVLDDATAATNVDASGVKDVENGEPGASYTTTDHKPKTIKVGDKVYKLVEKTGTTTGATPVNYVNGVVVGEGASAEEGSVEAGVDKVVTYVYEEVKGNVVVKYIDENGDLLAGEAVMPDGSKEQITTAGIIAVAEGAVGDSYDTTTKKATKITTPEGKVFELAGNVENGVVIAENSVKDGSAPENGDAAKVKEEEQTVTYVYKEVKGNVVVKYETTDGTQLSGNVIIDGNSANINPAGVPVAGATDVSGGTSYNTATLNKPTTITTAEGKVYKLVAKAEAGKYAANGVKDGSAPENGDAAKVVAGETLTVTYVYEEVKGNVVVKYIDENGNLLAGEAVMPDGSKEQITTSGVIAEKDASIGTAYDTTTKKATKITTADGKVFELAGNVENGVVIAENSVKDGSAPENGDTAKVKEEEQTVTYVYKEVKGNVVVKYETTDGVALDGQLTADGKEITVPATGIMDTPAGGDSVGANYETFDHKARTIVKDGKTYRLVAKEEAGKYSADGVKAGSDAEKGTVAEGTKTVTYVYEEVKQGTVIVKYEDVNGNEISPEVKVADQEEVQAGKTYDTTERKLAVIKKDNKLYQLVTKAEAGKYSADGVKVGSDAEKGALVEGTKTVTYVYEEITPAPSKGSVIVHYVDEDGKPVDNTEIVVNNKDVDTDYTTTPKEVPGYTFVKISDASAPANGKVKEGITEVTYVYKKAQTGSVVVKYVDEKGNPISGTTTGIAKPSVATTEKDVDAQGKEVTDVAVGTKYDTTDLRPQTITTADGKVYELVVEKVPANEKGDVVAGETVVTYVYKEVKGSVLVKYVTTDGTPLTGELTADGNKVTVPTTGLVDTPESSVDTAYNTQDLRPTTIVKDGVTYRLVPARTQGAEAGKVVKGETVITYVYEKVQDVKRGSVVVKYVNEKGIEIKDPIYDERDQEVGKAYDTREHKPSPITGKDGKVYELVAVRGNETGSVVEGETTVTYVYREVLSPRPEQKVMTYFVDEAGNTLLAAKLGTHVAEVIPGYVLVESKTDAAGNTIHVYAKVKPGMPSQPSNPAVKPEVQPTSTKPAQAMKELPNTGTEDHAGLAALGLAGLLGGFGLVARKRKED